jgi:hypothetical protein
VRLLIILFVLCLVTSSCKNFYEEMSATDTDAAILYSARMSLASGDWDTAISEFAKLSATTLAQTEVVIDRASAYSGRCGLDFLGLADAIQNMGATPLLQMLSNNFVVTTAASTADCIIAENLLKTIADVNGVVATERGQFLMAFSSLAKVGTILNFYSDTNDDGTADDVPVTATKWDACSMATGLTDIPNADIAEITTGLVLFYKNLQGTSFGAAITAKMTAACAAAVAPYDFCNDITTASVTPEHRQMTRALVVETGAGIGLVINGGGPANAPACPQ